MAPSRHIRIKSADRQSDGSPEVDPLRSPPHDLLNALIRDGLYPAEDPTPIAANAADSPAQMPGLGWRVSPEPFWITSEDLRGFEALGTRLLAFYAALNRLYFGSVRGTQPPWVCRYLDQGKPETVVDFGRMNRFKHHLPGMIRPDLILTDDGWIATELDSVPGGAGLTASMAKHYSEIGFRPVGGAGGIAAGFAKMIRSAAGRSDPTLAIIVSEESRDYRPEMRWMGRALNGLGLKTFVIEPTQIRFTEEGLRIEEDGSLQSIDVIYRFFELFDLKNIPKYDLILFSAKKGLVTVTPPLKAYLEEKMGFALFHHPGLRKYWEEALGDETVAALRTLIPPTWILDPREVPPHAVIPDLTLREKPVSNWQDLIGLTQKERRYIIKLSGFSERAWGSRGVVVGHDLSEKEWALAVERALGTFADSPSILQEFRQGKKIPVRHMESGRSTPRSMMGRVRLSPYYFVADGKAELAGILATVCPLDKKLIHGMTEAVMVPCAVRSDT